MRAGGAAFPTTRWTLVAEARGGDTARRDALEALLGAYWVPVWVYARRRGLGPDDAADLVQDLFAELLAKDFAQRLDPARGRLRGFLKSCVDHRLAHRRARAAAAKRAPESRALPLDPELAERALGDASANPEEAFQRAWAERVMARAMDRLRGEFARGERGGDFALVERFFGAGPAPSYREAAAEAGMTLPQLKAFLHRARARFRALALEEVRDTVADPADAERELAELIGGGG